MAEVTEQRILDVIAFIKRAFQDGFQFADVATVIEGVVEFADLFALTGSEKRELAIRVANRVIDETNVPLLPDVLVDPVLKRLVPSLIDLVVDATKGKLDVNS